METRRKAALDPGRRHTLGATKRSPAGEDGAVHQGRNPREAAKQPVVVVVYSVCLWLQDKVPLAEEKVSLRGGIPGDPYRSD